MNYSNIGMNRLGVNPSSLMRKGKIIVLTVAEKINDVGVHFEWKISSKYLPLMQNIVIQKTYNGVYWDTVDNIGWSVAPFPLTYDIFNEIPDAHVTYRMVANYGITYKEAKSNELSIDTTSSIVVPNAVSGAPIDFKSSTSVWTNPVGTEAYPIEWWLATEQHGDTDFNNYTAPDGEKKIIAANSTSKNVVSPYGGGLKLRARVRYLTADGFSSPFSTSPLLSPVYYWSNAPTDFVGEESPDGWLLASWTNNPLGGVQLPIWIYGRSNYYEPTLQPIWHQTLGIAYPAATLNDNNGITPGYLTKFKIQWVDFVNNRYSPFSEEISVQF